MNIVFILGNGFDMNLDMKTSYKNFYEEYLTTKSDNSIVSKFKNNIKVESDKWSNLESRLGEYTEDLNSLGELEEIMQDVEDNLEVYLQKEEDKLKHSKVNKALLLNHFIFPEKLLAAKDKQDITLYKNRWVNESWQIDVITFNYTKTLERLFENTYQNVNIGKFRTNNVSLRGIEHIHGYVDEMILGVNDESQIDNKTLIAEKYARNTIIKSQRNQDLKHLIDEKCIRQIASSQLICIFGSAIGKTDKLWWDLIGERLKQDCYVIIFDISDPEKVKGKLKFLRREEDILKDRFLSMTSLSEEEQEEFKSKVFVGLDTKMFKDIVTPVTKEILETTTA